MNVEKEHLNVEKEHMNVEGTYEYMNVEKEHLKFKVDILCQRSQLLKEGTSPDDIDSILPIVNY